MHNDKYSYDDPDAKNTSLPIFLEDIKSKYSLCDIYDYTSDKGIAIINFSS